MIGSMITINKRRERMNIAKVKLSVLFLFLFAFYGTSFSEKMLQDTVDVPVEYPPGNIFGVLNGFIMGDTTASGERVNPDRVYRLKRGEIYDIDFNMNINGWNLTLVAEKDDPQHPKRPPMVIRGVDPQGAYISGLMDLNGDSCSVKLEGILFQGVQDDGDVNVAHGASFLRTTGSHLRIEFINCIFNGWGGNILNAQLAQHSTFKFIDNRIRNSLDLDNLWGGNFYAQIEFNVDNDSIIFINNTIFNFSSYLLLSWEFVKYVDFTHNTVVITDGNPIWANYLVNAKINDNIFYNYQIVGETEYETTHGYWDREGNRSSICKLSPCDPQVLIDHNMTEADRKVEFKNNVYFWSDDIKTYWATHKDSSQGVEYDILPVTWINDSTAKMFNNDNAYPFLIEENNDELDPGFDADMIAEVMEKQIVFVKNYRRWGITLVDPKERFYAPGTDEYRFFDLPWPLEEDLSYTNSEVLTHAQGGYPAGDLNWFPDKKKQWEKWVTTIHENESSMNSPEGYKLSQNYPNPFNPTTKINFSIPFTAKTSLIVYNILGQKVATILDEKLSAGSYKYEFDGSDLSSGLYFYKLQSKNYTAIKKMILIK